METNLKEKMTVLTETEVDFNWDVVSNHFIPKYDDIIKELKTPSGKLGNDMLNNFRYYDGIVESVVKDLLLKESCNDYRKTLTIDINNKDNVLIERGWWRKGL